MNNMDVMTAHLLVGSIGASGLLVVALFLRRACPFQSTVWFYITSVVTAFGVACVFASFALGFVWVGTGSHLSLATPSRGAFVGFLCFCFVIV
jgi:hypothetical protein